MEAENPGKHYLYPSALFAEKDPYVVDTVLGSCVSICLYDTKLKCGGINHYMLPLWNGDGLASPKYGNIAIKKLVEKMLVNGSVKSNIVAKIFGGANQMTNFTNIGERNVQIAEDMMKEYGISVIARNTGGHVGRKIRFNTSSGEVLMRMLNK